VVFQTAATNYQQFQVTHNFIENVKTASKINGKGQMLTKFNHI